MATNKQKPIKKLGYSSLTNSVYYGTVGQDKYGCYWKKKELVSNSDFVETMLAYLKNNCDEKGDLCINANGITVCEININMMLWDVDTKKEGEE